MSYYQKTKAFLILLIMIQLASCGGSKNTPDTLEKNNYRLLSIDYDKGTNDSVDNKFYYEYDIEGNNIKIENTNFNNTLLSTTTIKTFNKNNKLLKTTEKSTHPDPKMDQMTILRQWVYTYDQTGQKNSEKYEDFKNHKFYYWVENKGTRTSYSKSGEILTINRFTTDFTGHKLHELIDTNNDSRADKEINSTYNNNGKLLTKIITDPNDDNKAKLYQESRTYDSNGNILSKTTSQPFKNTEKHIIKYQYSYDTHKNILSSSTNYMLDDQQVRTDTRIYVWEKISPMAYFNAPINWAGTGCKAGSVSVSGSNTNSLSILFDAYDAGKDAKSGLSRSACSFSIPIQIPSAYTFKYLTADWEGYVEGKGEISRKYFLTGQTQTLWKRNAYNKPDGANFTIRDNINHTPLSSGCAGGLFNLRIESQLKTTGEDSYAAIDSTDLHSKIKLKLHLRPCNK